MNFMGKRLLVILTFSFCIPGVAQITYSARQSSNRIEFGGGLDYWATDYSGRWKTGPAAWAETELWRGFGIVAEGHSLIAGGNLPNYKYIVGEGGADYTVHQWRKALPYVKAEAGFAGLDFPRSANYRSHDTRTTWALGGGLEYRTSNHLWTRIDYTYDFFPGFLSFVTFKEHTLNPNGISLGMSYHIR